MANLRNFAAATTLATLLNVVSLNAQADGNKTSGHTPPPKNPPANGPVYNGGNGGPAYGGDGGDGGKGVGIGIGQGGDGGNGYGGNGYGGAGGNGYGGAAAAAAEAAANAANSNSINIRGSRVFNLNGVGIGAAGLGDLMTQSPCQSANGKSNTVNIYVAAWSRAVQNINPEGVPLDPTKFDITKMNPLELIVAGPGQELTPEQKEINESAKAAWNAFSAEDKVVYNCIVRYAAEAERNRASSERMNQYSANVSERIANRYSQAMETTAKYAAFAPALSTAVQHPCNLGGQVEPKTGLINEETLAHKRRVDQQNNPLKPDSHELCEGTIIYMLETIGGKPFNPDDIYKKVRVTVNGQEVKAPKGNATGATGGDQGVAAESPAPTPGQ